MFGESKTCPYCGAINCYTYWLSTKSSQTDLKGHKLGIDLKLKLPRCTKCGNVLRYYLNSYGVKVSFTFEAGACKN